MEILQINPAQMNPNQLTRALTDLLRRGRCLDADFLVHLAEVNRRRLFIEAGYTTLWEYCTRKLGLPKGATFRRVTCVELLGRHPPAIDYLRDGRLSMTALVLLKDVLSVENAAEWLERAAGKSCEDIELMVGAARSRPERCDGMRKLPMPVAPALPAAAEPVLQFASSKPVLAEITLTAPAPAEPEVEAIPVSAKPERYQFTATGDQELKLLYEKARELLSHKIPRNDPTAVLKLALSAVIEKEEKRRGIRRKPRLRGPSIARQSARAPA